MAKIHLVETEFSITSGHDIAPVPLCGKEIKRAEICFMWDDLRMQGEIEVPIWNTCATCLARISDGFTKERRYVYGVTEKKEERA